VNETKTKGIAARKARLEEIRIKKEAKIAAKEAKSAAK